ncbi:MAG TPA: peptidylprolyl isomerase [Bacteroidota bacterium]|nr:peptidylprolyl isomerase [Bacteroidota bacterium]
MKNIIAILFLSVSSLCAQDFTSQEKEILQLQDQRSLGDGTLISYLHSGDTHLRFLAVRALANIQDTSSVRPLIFLLKDSSDKVREMTAFALGQIGGDSAERALCRALNSEQDSAILSRVLEALGKSGSASALDSVLEYAEKKSNRISAQDVALSFARFAIRGIKSERAIWKCFDYLYSADPLVRANALYALWRCAPHGLLDIEIAKHAELLDSLSRDKNADVRLNCALVLGHSQSNDAVQIVKNRIADITHENDWHVRLGIVRALGVAVTTSHDLLQQYVLFLPDANDHVTITALQGLYSVSPALWQDTTVALQLKNKIAALAEDKNICEAVRGEAMVTLGRFFPDELRRYNVLADSAEVSSRLKAKYLNARSQIISKANLSLDFRYLDSSDALLSMTAWECLRRLVTPRAMSILQLDSTQTASLPQMIWKKATTALSYNDIGVTTLVANFCADTVAFAPLKKAHLAAAAVDEFITAYKKLKVPDGMETMQAVVEALGSIGDPRAIPFLESLLRTGVPSIAAESKIALKILTGKTYSAPLPVQTFEAHSKKDWKLLEGIEPHQHVLLATTKGNVVLELLKEDAPFTVLSFVKLIQQHYYDGLIFHRVIPNFVVQGGDPRGDGWGGPDFILRTETSLVKFERGSCGMASAGKDTEGSQFFITHMPTPHLDGRYTIFGTVIQGMEIVDRLQIGDKILSLQLAD